MIISARVHYAAIALTDLAVQKPLSASEHSHAGTPVAVREITDRHGIPGPFLVQILRTLRTAGWVESIRGSQGGYRLAVDPRNVTLLDIAEAIGCQESGCWAESNPSVVDEALQSVWSEASEASRNVLSATRISDLAEAARQDDETMFYI